MAVGNCPRLTVHRLINGVLVRRSLAVQNNNPLIRIFSSHIRFSGPNTSLVRIPELIGSPPRSHGPQLTGLTHELRVYRRTKSN